MNAGRSLLSGATALAILALNGGAQSPGSALVERVTAASDSAVRYALLRPPGDADTASRPVLIVLDPRGRAQLALNVFRHAADELGWRVLSSYDTRSDDPGAPNARAVNALVKDAEQRWRASRVYLAGFSGTAREIWDYAAQLRSRIAGIVSIGGGVTAYTDPPRLLDEQDANLAAALGAGVADFNWLEVRESDVLLRERGRARRGWYYPGGHAWPPPDVGAAMLDWLEAEARRSGPEADSTWLAQYARRQQTLADSLEARGRLVDALAIHEDVARQMSGAPISTRAAGQRQRLETLPAVRAHRRAEERMRQQERAALDAASLTLVTSRLSSRAPDVRRLTLSLRIAELLRTAQRRDSLASPSAQRRLESIFVQLSFYEPRDYLAAGDSARARTMLRVAATIDSARAARAAAALGMAR